MKTKAVPETFSPVAVPAAVHVSGRARFTALTEGIVRMEYDSSERFEDRETMCVCNRRLPVPAHTFERIEGGVRLRTDRVELCYSGGGAPFSKNNLTATFRVGDYERGHWRFGMRDSGNLKGAKRTLDSHHGAWFYFKKEQRWHKAEVEPGFLSRDGWTVHDDSRSIPLQPDDGVPWCTARETGDGSRLDLYLIAYGRDYRAALADLVRIFGAQPLPPRFTLGYWWSRWWSYTDKELEELADSFDTFRLPLDVLVIDMDWHKPGWTGYTWDEDLFPDHRAFLRRMKRRGLKVALNLHPANGVGRHEAAYPAMAKAIGLDAESNGDIPLDCTSKRYMDAYFRCLHHPLEKEGVDFWWLDWQQGRTSAIAGLDPLAWLNRRHWEDMQARPSGDRPLIFSRFGGPGSGRYAIGFSGDTESSWRTLAFLVPYTAQSANSLYGHWSHDIGGFFPSPFEGPLTPEMYLRFVQFGIHSPIFRTHSSKTHAGERRLWAHGEPYGSLMCECVRQRYAAVPYIYTENWKATRTGVSLCRPLYYDWPEEPEAYKAGEEYQFGDQMLVAPVVRPADDSGLATKRVWLPPGEWIDIAQGSALHGGRWVTRRYTLREVPVFVRRGAIVPGQREVSRLRAGGYRDLTLTVYPGGDTAYELYEDDGVSRDHQDGGYVTVTIRHAATGRRRTVTIEPARGRYSGFDPSRSLELRLPFSAPPTTVTVNGSNVRYRPGARARAHWRYDGELARCVISVPVIRLDTQTTVVVEGPSDNVTLNAIPARLERLGLAFQKLCPARFQREREVARLWQTGRRVTMQPGTWREEYAALTAPTALSAILSAMDAEIRKRRPKEEKEARAKRLAWYRQARSLLTSETEQERTQRSRHV
jgi:alpha-glucosidase (family GH31 glycosyl hydrolase)